MALVHDIQESIVGDIMPEKYSGVTKEDKHEMEEEAIGRIGKALGGFNESAGENVVGLWREYEAAETPEALLLKDLDKFEMIVQADEYEREQGLVLQDFFDSTKGKFKNKVVKGWVEELVTKREERMNANKTTK